MISAQVVETSVTTTKNSPSQNLTHKDDVNWPPRRVSIAGVSSMSSVMVNRSPQVVCHTIGLTSLPDYMKCTPQTSMC